MRLIKTKNSATKRVYCTGCSILEPSGHGPRCPAEPELVFVPLASTPYAEELESFLARVEAYERERLRHLAVPISLLGVA